MKQELKEFDGYLDHLYKSAPSKQMPTTYKTILNVVYASFLNGEKSIKWLPSFTGRSYLVKVWGKWLGLKGESQWVK